MYAEWPDRTGMRWEFASEQEARNHHALTLLDSGATRADVVRVGDPVPAWVVDSIAAKLAVERAEMARLRSGWQDEIIARQAVVRERDDALAAVAALERRVATAEAERDAARTCTGCDSPRLTAILAVLAGQVACCPDCSTLTLPERNALRAALTPPGAPGPRGRAAGEAGADACDWCGKPGCRRGCCT